MIVSSLCCAWLGLICIFYSVLCLIIPLLSRIKHVFSCYCMIYFTLFGLNCLFSYYCFAGIDIRSSKICELGLFDHKAKNLFNPFEGNRYDYYWASVFKVIISCRLRVCIIYVLSDALCIVFLLSLLMQNHGIFSFCSCHASPFIIHAILLMLMQTFDKTSCVHTHEQPFYVL